MSEDFSIRQVEELGSLLLEVEKPGRYVGGEFGRLAKTGALLQAAIAFPDLYEIGMSNQALRIIYNRLNEMEDVSCDRVFAPAPDFESLLKKKGMPLYGLDTGIPLNSLDILLFTLAYELGITSVLTILDTGGIPVRSEKRGEGSPIIIMGGPCVSNPLPYAPFIDAFWIGEAEAGFFDLAAELLELKKRGASRKDTLSHIAEHPSIWVRGKKQAVRAIDSRFSLRPPFPAVFPVSSMKTVQHHGAVEIMRGCPNGCRFCHAGYWYRPMRQKSADRILAETEVFVSRGGYREISLSSLSSGDYRHIDALIESLNSRFGSRHVSFQLPSLRVSTFSLPLLEKISEVRKSGLTFAVETPEDAWQLSINKRVSLADTASILNKARKNGWRGAKFYFMLGLPVIPDIPAADPEHRLPVMPNEEESIVNFILELGRVTGMHFNVAAGVFVPKPHTPYQWAAQLDEESAHRKLEYIRSRLKPKGHKINTSDPFMSLLEGVLSRGTEETAELIEEAWRQGCRLDAWQDYLKKEIWRNLLEHYYQEQVSTILNGRPEEKTGEVPWHMVQSGVGANYLRRELNNSKTKNTTSSCTLNCTHPCGICAKSVDIVQNSIHGNIQKNDIGREDFIDGPQKPDPQPPVRSMAQREVSWRVVFSFGKRGGAVFHSHLSLIEIFSMAFMRARIPVIYSQGFNPLPALEITAPLSIGIAADGEMALIETREAVDPSLFLESMNVSLPEGIWLNRAENYSIKRGEKKRSLSSLLWGFVYAVPKFNGSPLKDMAAPETVQMVRPAAEKEFRKALLDARGTIFGLRRLAVLAASPAQAVCKDNQVSLTASRGPAAGESYGESYFDVYRILYPEMC
ncbi:MAG: TIGR03936 family radical SAM-associated protein [Treponema sp.]|jgi:radical SAM-linked protein|nr:TIGR03936 family radical SAM-associated protein [Treponema sp.]